MLTIRDETPRDYDRIRGVTVAAFAGSEFGHNGEADLIDALRSAGGEFLSLVACRENELVGQVLFTPVVIRRPERETHGMGLGPMSVLPRHQNSGVGSSLIKRGLRRLFDDGCPFVVVLGHAEYYPRFGFRPAAEFGVTHGFAGIPQHLFFLHPAADCPLAALTDGAAYYHGEFGPQHAG